MIRITAYFFLANILLSCSKDEAVIAPSASFTYSPSKGCAAPCEVTFKSTSKNANSFEWDLGDDGPKLYGDSVKYTYKKAKIATVTLIATGPGGTNKISQSVNITEPAAEKPVADFKIVGGDNCEVPCKVNFVNTSTNETVYLWNFGDKSTDSTSTWEDPIHEFKTAGTFNIKLVVNGAGGKDSTVKILAVKPKAVSPPEVDFLPVIDCSAPCKCYVSFVNLTKNESAATTYLWDFGNDIKSTEKSPAKVEYTPDSEAFYSVKLRATNADGSSDEKSQQLKIEKTKVEISEVFVEGGEFNMGSDDGKDDAKPVHKVTVSGFFIDKYEVTIEEWKTYKNAVKINMTFPGYDYSGCSPMVNISWKHAAEFCNWLSQEKKLTPCYSISGDAVTWNVGANGYRLPTEAEWEYAATGGKKTAGKIYSGSDNQNEVAWYKSNSNDGSRAIGTKSPNELGLYDMSGNAYEWCWDWLNFSYYGSSASNNPTGPEKGEFRVARGGDYTAEKDNLKTTFRGYYDPKFSTGFIGFRVVRNP